MKYRPPIDCNETREDPDEYFGCWHIILASVLLFWSIVFYIAVKLYKFLSE